LKAGVNFNITMVMVENNFQRIEWLNFQVLTKNDGEVLRPRGSHNKGSSALSAIAAGAQPLDVKAETITSSCAKLAQVKEA
jgi:hypothetical protein